MKRFALLLILTFFAYNFSMIAQVSEPITIQLKKSDLKGKSAVLSSVADKISYIKLETLPDALIGRASRYQNYSVVSMGVRHGVLDLLFGKNATGSRIYCLGRTRSGPGSSPG